MPPALPEHTIDALVAAALLVPDGHRQLGCAEQLAATSRDRQLVAIAAAHLDGEHDRVDALARDHLVDHPHHVRVACIAGASRRLTPEPRS